MNTTTDWSAVDPTAEFNEDTRLVHGVLVDKLGPELGMEATAALITVLGGCRYQIVSPNPIEDRQQKERAAEMLADGLTPIEVMRKTHLSLYQVKKLQREAA